MIEHQVTFNFKDVLYLNAQSTNVDLIIDIEKAVEKIIQEHYPNVLKVSKGW